MAVATNARPYTDHGGKKWRDSNMELETPVNKRT